MANAVDTRTRGVDIVADYSLRLGPWGNLGLDAAFNYNHTKVTNIAAAPAALTPLAANNPGGSLIYLPRATIGDLTVNLPQTKFVFGAHWNKGRVAVDIQTTRYGSYDYVRSEIVSQDSHFGAKCLSDLSATYEVVKGIKLTAGASNLFNVKPDANGPIDPATGGASLTYGPAPFNPLGGFYYGRVSFDF